MALFVALPASAQITWGDHEARCVIISSDDGTTTTCLCETSDRIWEDTDCDQTKDSGEYFVAERNIADFFNGTFKESFDAFMTSNGTNLTMTLQQSGGGDLTSQFSTGDVVIDCTPFGTCDLDNTDGLTPGLDTAPQENFVYVLESTGVLTVSTSAWPSEEHTKVAYFLCQSAASVQTDGGCYINQNWNDHQAGTDDQGHMSHMAERSRRLGAVYASGIDGNGTSDYVTITTQVGSQDNVDILTTAGIIYQMHTHNYPAKDTLAGGDVILMVNDSATAYKNVSDLGPELTDANGNSMQTAYYNLVLWGVANKSGDYGPLMINLPECSYNTAANALADADGCDVFSIPAAFKTESSTGFLIARITLKHANASGGTTTVESTVDLRGITPVSAGAGGVGSNQTEFADNVFTIFDDGDTTKVFKIQANNISTGTTRTWTVPDTSDVFVGEKHTQTFTNKTFHASSNSIDLSSNTINGIVDDQMLIGDGANSAAYVTIDSCDAGTQKHIFNGTGFVCVNDQEQNDLETVVASINDAEIFIGTGVESGQYVAGLAPCASNEKPEYTPGAPDTLGCEAIAIAASAITDLNANTDITADLEEEDQISETNVTGEASSTAVLFGTGANAASWDTTPAIDCSDCTNLPSGASALGDLTDVTLTTPGDGAVLCFTGTGDNSVDCTVGGDATATEDSGTLTVTVVDNSHDHVEANITDLAHTVDTDTTCNTGDQACTLDDDTITSGSNITLAQGVAPTPTAEGRIEWETDDDHIIVGDGAAGQVEFVPAEDVSGDATMTDAGVVTVGDDTHAHTGTTLSGVDISDDTNLAVTAPVVLTDDTLSLNQNAGTDVTADLEEENEISETVVSGEASINAVLFGTNVSTASWDTTPAINLSDANNVPDENSAGSTGDVQYAGATAGSHDAEAAFNYAEDSNELTVGIVDLGTAQVDDGDTYLDTKDSNFKFHFVAFTRGEIDMNETYPYNIDHGTKTVWTIDPVGDNVSFVDYTFAANQGGTFAGTTNMVSGNEFGVTSGSEIRLHDGSFFRQSVDDSVAAAGNSLGTATLLDSMINEVTSATAGSADGVKVPACATEFGQRIVVINESGVAIDVWPFDAIDGNIGAGIGTEITLADGSILVCDCFAADEWACTLTTRTTT